MTADPRLRVGLGREKRLKEDGTFEYVSVHLVNDEIVDRATWSRAFHEVAVAIREKWGPKA